MLKFLWLLPAAASLFYLIILGLDIKRGRINVHLETVLLLILFTFALLFSAIKFLRHFL